MTVHTIPAETLAGQNPSIEEGTWDGMNPTTDEDQLVLIATTRARDRVFKPYVTLCSLIILKKAPI